MIITALLIQNALCGAPKNVSIQFWRQMRSLQTKTAGNPLLGGFVLHTIPDRRAFICDSSIESFRLKSGSPPTQAKSQFPAP
jgi:hypothetical protein